MKISKPKPNAIRTIACLMLVSAIGVLLTRSHWCLPVSTAQITYNGKPSPGSHLYGIGNGDLVLNVRNPRETLYLINPHAKKVYLPNGTNVLSIFGVIFIVHLDQGGVNLEQTAKTGLRPDILAGDNFIEFTGFSRGRIKATW